MTAEEEHLRLLSIFYYVAAAFRLLMSCVTLIFLGLGVFLFGAGICGGRDDDAVAAGFVGVIFAVIGLCMLVFEWTVAALTFAAGRCLARRKRHTFCLVVAGINCLWFPHGTALGVFTFILLLKPAVKALFAPPLPLALAT